MPISPPTWTRTQTRCSNSQAERASLRFPAVKCVVLLPTSNSSFAWARAVHHWRYFLLASLGTDKAEKAWRSHLAEAVADYSAFKKGVETLFDKYEFEGSCPAMLRTHLQAGFKSVTAYAARTTNVCSKAYTGFSTETQLSLAVDHFIASLADSTSRDFAPRPCVPPAGLARDCSDGTNVWSLAHLAARTRYNEYKTGALSLDEHMCVPAESTAAPAL